MNSSALGGVSILAGTLFIPWVGAWVLDVDLDLASSQALPSGKVTPNVGDTTLTGTIDARGTGRFGEKGRARVVAGAGGWSSTVVARHFHSDAGLLSSTVLQATAADAGGETVNDANPVTIGIDYVRLAGPASRVLELGGRDWYVDATGVTQIADWPTLTPSSDVDVLDYDPETRMLLLSADSIVWPGTVFTSTTFGTVTVRDVEVAIAPSSFRIKAWCSGAPSSRLQASLRTQIREYSQADFGKLWMYRITTVGSDGRLQLEAVNESDPIPALLPISVWPGCAGFFADFVTGTSVIVEFIAGDPTQPIIRGFAPPSAPDLVALVKVALAPLVDQAVTNIVNGHNSHTHPYMNGTTAATTSAPTAPIAGQQSVAAKIARAR